MNPLPTGVIADIKKSLPGPSFAFISYLHGTVQLYSCKESAGFAPYEFGDKTYLIIRGNSQESIINNLKKWAAFWNIDVETEIFEVEHVGSAYNRAGTYKYSRIEGWFNQNILTREMCRFLINNARSTRNHNDLAHLSKNHYLVDHLDNNYNEEIAEKCTKFLLNMKELVEKAEVTNLAYGSSGGFIKWIYYNRLLVD